jgi:hypothetical protein
MREQLGQRIIDAIDRRELIHKQILAGGPKVRIYDGSPIEPSDKIDFPSQVKLHTAFDEASREVERCTIEYQRFTLGQ